MAVEGTSMNSQKKTQPPPPQQQEPQPPLESSVTSGGSVLVDKVFEPLNAMLEAFEARLKPGQTQEERWRAYPEPALEKERLNMYTQLIKAVQSLIDKSSPNAPSVIQPTVPQPSNQHDLVCERE